LITGNNKKDSMWIEVKEDTRLTERTEVVKKQDELLAKYQPSIDKFNHVLDQLDEIDALLNQLKEEWKDKKDKCIDTLNKAHKVLTTKSKEMREFMMGKKQEKQGYGIVEVITPFSIIRDASMLILGKNSLPGAQEEKKLQEAEVAIQNVITKANEFFTKDWDYFRKLVEANPVAKFKDYESIK
jgi:hypothetical protein